MSKCPDCDYENDNLVALSVHYRKGHKKTAEQLRIELFHFGSRPVCACGCDGEVRFCGIKTGFSEFVLGHHSRVKNNWGHNTEAQQKSQDKRRQQIAEGTWKPWNKGSDASTDLRVQANNVAISQSIMNKPDERKSRSERLKKGRLDGTVPTLTGAAHSQWRGGTSALQPIVRSHLHSIWTYPKLKTSGFKCSVCGAPGPGLEVHHDKEHFATILRKAVDVFGPPGDDFGLKSQIAEWVACYHVQHDVSGIVLCEQCHARAHAVE